MNPPYSLRHRPRLKGITLCELLVTLAITAALAAIAVPGFSETRRNAALTSSVNQMLGALHFARSAAILRNVPAVVCLSPDGVQCASRANEPARSWLVFYDIRRSTPPDREPEDIFLRQGTVPPNLSIRGSRAAVTFWPTSRSGTPSTFTFCDIGQPNGDSGKGRSVIVSQTGRPRVAAAAAGRCAP